MRGTGAFGRRLRGALSPHTLTGVHDAALCNSGLPPVPAVDAIHRIVNDASRLTRRWYACTVDCGLSDGRYVELVGTVVSVPSIDSFCRAIGVPLHPLPEPAPRRLHRVSARERRA